MHCQHRKFRESALKKVDECASVVCTFHQQWSSQVPKKSWLFSKLQKCREAHCEKVETMKRALALASNVVRGKHTTSAWGELREAARSQQKLPQKNIQRKKGSVSKATNTKPGRAPYIPTCHLNLSPQPFKTQPHEL